MKLNEEGLKNKEVWLEKGYDVFDYDREKIKQKTKHRPFWLHFGDGNIFKAFQANVIQKLLNKKMIDRGLIVAEGYDYDIVEIMGHPYDELVLLATLKADGTVGKSVIGSIMEALILDQNHPDYCRLIEIFCNRSLQMVSFTITEKGYDLYGANGKILPEIQTDIERGPQLCVSYMGKVVALLYKRYSVGKFPIAMVSMDNCSHNGEKLYEAIHTIAVEWAVRNLVEQDFVEYIENENMVSFPWTMIDKITPRPAVSIENLFERDGIEDIQPIVTKKKTYIAPFVNAEECEYLVIEDKFPNGRSQLEFGGFIFTDRETVNKVEKMKVCTCLNPLHTSLAIFGCLLGYRTISDEMKDPLLVNLIKRVGYQEGLPVVTDPGIIHPKDFIDTVIQIRFPNPFMPDTPQRIATDTSSKLSIRFGETIKEYIHRPELSTTMLTYIPLVLAGWIRYLMGIDDEGTPFEISPDPLLDELKPIVDQLTFGMYTEVEKIVSPILHMETVFGVDLYEANLAASVINYLIELMAGKHAVRNTLDKYCK